MTMLQRLGNQTPTLRTACPYSESHGEKAYMLMKAAGYELMDWQRSILTDWLAFSGGKFAHANSGLSIPRQNGKTLTCSARIAHGMVAYGEWVVYTAHLQKTATETFEELQAIFESRALKSKVDVIKTALGREEIRLKNGGRVKFLARTRNGGRGQHGDLLVFDEAQEVTDEMQASFIPSISASRNPQTLYLGTPPDDGAAGNVFERIRSQASDNGTCWNEWGTSSCAGVDNEALWAMCNPSYGYRIMEETVRSELTQLSPEKFARERLGWWSETGHIEPVITSEQWENTLTDSPCKDGLLVYAVKFSADGSCGSLAVCRKPDAGTPHVEIVETRDMAFGLSWFVDWLVQRKDRPQSIVVDGASNAQNLIDTLINSGVPKRKLIKPSTRDFIAATSAFLDAIKTESVTHYYDEALDASATKTGKRRIGKDGGFGFETTEYGDATLIESCCLAYWAAMNAKPKREGRIAYA